MADEPKVASTAAGDITLPVQDVTLTGRALKRKDGAPLVVRVEFIEEERLLSIIESAPGHATVLGAPRTADERENIETARALLKYAPGIIAASCALVGPDGSEQRPGFHFGADPHDGSLPGRFLTTPEKLTLLMTSLRVSGFAGGPADDMRFPDAERAGRSDGAGTVDAGEGNGDAASAVAAWEAEGGRTPADAGAGR